MNPSDRNSRTPATIPSRTVSSPYGNNNRDDDNDGRTRQLVQRALHEIALLTPQKQAAVGGISGIAAGYCFAKASKAAAFAIGASIIGLALASQSGYVDIHFDRIKNAAQKQLDDAKRAAQTVLPPSTTTNVDGEEIETFVDQSSSHIVNSLKNFALANLALTSSFVGGFLLGVAFE